MRVKRFMSIILVFSYVGDHIPSGCSGGSKGGIGGKGLSVRHSRRWMKVQRPARRKETITLRYFINIGHGDRSPLEQAMADAYMKEHPNVKIELIGQPVNDMAKKS